MAFVLSSDGLTSKDVEAQAKDESEAKIEGICGDCNVRIDHLEVDRRIVRGYVRRTRRQRVWSLKLPGFDAFELTPTQPASLQHRLGQTCCNAGRLT
jgi:hypothetical protein